MSLPTGLPAYAPFNHLILYSGTNDFRPTLTMVTTKENAVCNAVSLLVYPAFLRQLPEASRPETPEWRAEVDAGLLLQSNAAAFEVLLYLLFVIAAQLL